MLQFASLSLAAVVSTFCLKLQESLSHFIKNLVNFSSESCNFFLALFLVIVKLLAIFFSVLFQFLDTCLERFCFVNYLLQL